MSEDPNASAEEEQPSGPAGPFRVTGTDGSERNAATLELAQAIKGNAVTVHDGEGHEFTIRDANGDPIG